MSKKALWIIGAFLVLAVAGALGAQSQERNDAELKRIADVLEDAKRELREARDGCSTGLCNALAQVRSQQRTFVKAHQKFPDYIDVGITVWESAHDWHIRHQHPMNIVRFPDGRRGITFFFTTLVLRSDQDNNFVGFPYDVK